MAIRFQEIEDPNDCIGNRYLMQSISLIKKLYAHFL